MTPDEEAALRAQLAGTASPAGSAASFTSALLGSPVVNPYVDQAKAFRDRVVGVAPQLAAPLLSQAPGLVGDAGMVAQATGLLPQGVRDRAGESAHRLVGPGRQMQSFEREEPASAPTAFRLGEMDTQPEPMRAAPTLDPKYGNAGRMQLGFASGPGGVNQFQKAYEDALAKQLATGDAEIDLARNLGGERTAKTENLSTLHTMEAKRQYDSALERQRIEEAAAESHRAFLARTEQLIEEVGKSKIDPHRFMRNQDIGTRVAMNIGAVASGMLRGLDGGPNRFLEHLDKQIADDIALQQGEIDNKKMQISARQSLFGQMLQETGDRRIAAMQTHNMMLEAAKVKLQADTERLGIPEARVMSNIIVNGLEQRQATLRTDIAAKSWQQYLQRQAAAAAAQRAAEKEMFERTIKITELGQKQDELDIKRIEAQGKAGEDINKQTQALGTAMSAKELTEGRAAVENMKQRLSQAKPGEGLPGVGRIADARAALRPTSTVGALNPVHRIADAALGLSPDERVSRGDWEKIKLAYQHQITGSGASNAERAMLSAAFEGAKTPEEQRNAVAQADDFFQRREEAIKAGFDPRVVNLYEQRRQGYVLKDAGAQVKK